MLQQADTRRPSAAARAQTARPGNRGPYTKLMGGHDRVRGGSRPVPSASAPARRGNANPARARGPAPYEALGRVVHEAQLEALLVPEALGQREPDVVGREGLLPTVLELGEDGLRSKEHTGR